MAVAIMVLPVPVIATTTVDTTVGEAMDMVARSSDRTTMGNQKDGTQLDDTVPARGVTRFRTVSANGIADIDVYYDAT